jgi:superfamily II DNA or RNA helicase
MVKKSTTTKSKAASAPPAASSSDIAAVTKKALPELVIQDRLYIPLKLVDMRQMTKRYDRYIYDNNQCRRCEFREDRHSYACDECQHFKGRFKSFTEEIKNGKKYISLPRAELYNLEELGIKKYKLLVKTSQGTPLNKKLKLTRKLYDYQDACKSDMINGDGRKHYMPHGILKAPPRSGKTLTSIAIAIELGGKFLILANQEDLLKQFIIELKQSTNIEDVDKFEGKQSFGLCSKVEDFERYDICLATYQTFLSPAGKKKLKKIRKLFRTVLIDEVHRASAKCFSQVADAFHAHNRFGVTATDKRKDGMEFVVNQIIGHVITTAKSDTLKPKVYVIETKIKPPYAYKTWHGAMQFLVRSKERMKMVLEYVKKDLKNGHKIVIPVMYKKQAFELVEAIRKMGYTSEAFVAGVKRDELLARARAGKIDVVVGIRSIIATGVNVPRWSCIYTIAPISNPPNYYQETMRVCTPLEGKRQPIIRIFVDDMGMTKGCFRTCWFQTVVKHGFLFNDRHKEIASSIINTMGGRRYDDDGDEFKVYRDKTKSSAADIKSKAKTVSKWKPIGLFKRG